MSYINCIEVKDFSFAYSKENILDKIDFNIERGKFYSIIGPNGSGKTTLIKNLSKIIDESEKSIFIEGKDINKISFRELSKSIAVVSQDTGIEFEFSVMDIVLMGRNPYRKRFSGEDEEDLKIAEDAMKFADVWHLKDRNIRLLSGGERQRVLIARAVCQNTDMILLDEPISHLDIRYQIEILNKLKYLNKEKGVTIVSILHDLNLASAYSDYIILMNKGKIFSMGSSNDIINKENIKEVYNIDVRVFENPSNGKPYFIPVF